jgi:hypothetical protein
MVISGGNVDPAAYRGVLGEAADLVGDRVAGPGGDP